MNFLCMYFKKEYIVAFKTTNLLFLLSPACNDEHGHCVEGKTENFCLCNTGWQGDSCDDCCPYWNCPETNGTIACLLPNECRCSDTTKASDTTGLCDLPTLIKTP